MKSKLLESIGARIFSDRAGDGSCMLIGRDMTQAEPLAAIADADTVMSPRGPGNRARIALC
jgi:hypothetical protein